MKTLDPELIILLVIIGLTLVEVAISTSRISTLKKCATPPGKAALVCVLPAISAFIILVVFARLNLYLVGIVLAAVNLGVQIWLDFQFVYRPKENHQWNHCTCGKCGLYRNEQHDIPPKTCICKICKNEIHDLDGCTCKRCHKEIHDRVDERTCVCRRCNRTDIHVFQRGKCVYCGAKDPGHVHDYQIWNKKSELYPGLNYYKCLGCDEMVSGASLGYSTPGEG